MKREETTQEALQTILMAYRSTPCASAPNQVSPAENKRDLMFPTHPPINTSSSEQMKARFDCDHGATPRTYAPGDAVFVKDFRLPNTWLPGTIIARSESVKYTVACQEIEWIRHANQLGRRDHLPSSTQLLNFFDLPTPLPPSPDVFTLPPSPSLDCLQSPSCQDITLPSCLRQSSSAAKLSGSSSGSSGSSSGRVAPSTSVAPAQPPTVPTPAPTQPRHPYD